MTQEEKEGVTIWFFMFFTTVWMLLGVLARLWSIVCFVKKGTFQDKWMGLLTAMMFGPLYWIYYIIIGGNYCTDHKIRKKIKDRIQ